LTHKIPGLWLAIAASELKNLLVRIEIDVTMKRLEGKIGDELIGIKFFNQFFFIIK
jgi:hypothetical protein